MDESASNSISHTPTTSDGSTQTTWRTVLRGAGMLAFAGLAIMTFVGAAAAAPNSIETLHLTDSGGDNSGGSFLTRLYSVELDGSTSQTNQTLLADLSDSDLN